jgi:hypothetical protein
LLEGLNGFGLHPICLAGGGLVRSVIEEDNINPKANKIAPEKVVNDGQLQLLLNLRKHQARRARANHYDGGGGIDRAIDSISFVICAGCHSDCKVLGPLPFYSHEV